MKKLKHKIKVHSKYFNPRSYESWNISNIFSYLLTRENDRLFNRKKNKLHSKHSLLSHISLNT